MTPAAAADPAVQGVLHGSLAWLLLAAARHKLRDRALFRESLARYRILPGGWSGAAAVGLTAAEIGIGAALLVPPLADAAAGAAAGLLGLYSAAIAANLARGRRDIDCGCGGAGGRRPLSIGLLARNALLVAAALAAAAPAAPRALVWIDGLTVAGGIATLALLYAAVDATLAHAPRLRALGGNA